jgi:hypothetical protein
MVEIFVHDLRVDVSSPNEGPFYKVLRVDGSTPLANLVYYIWSLGLEHDRKVFLKILAHGITDMMGKYQIQLCREYLSLSTVDFLRPLKGFIRGIDIYSCNAARGEGYILCQNIASITGAFVRAAVKKQTGDYVNFLGLIKGPIDMGAWEGLVISFNPKGREYKKEESPKK